MKTKETKPLTHAEALEKLRHFCAYQERSPKQVLAKMKRLEVPLAWYESLETALGEEGFLSESRYLHQYTRGKSRIKGWGPRKIAQHLQFELGKDVSLSDVLQKEDFETALQKLKKDLRKKYETLKGKQDLDLKGKLIRFCLSRGFEMEDGMRLVREVMG
jgi:regulatory protein